MKKNKLITRIIAVVLVLTIVLGFVIPYVSAYDVDQSEIETMHNASEKPDMPDVDLPDGFEYSYVNGRWVINKTEENDRPAIAIMQMPEGFDATVLTVFICNLETYQVRSFDLFKRSGYVSSMDLADGYYVIFSNNFAWSSSSGEAHVINNNEYLYVYIGDDYDANLYPIDFERYEDIFEIALSPADDSTTKIAYNTALIYSPSHMVCPEDAIVYKNGSTSDNPTGPTTPTYPTEPTDPTEPTEPTMPTSPTGPSESGGSSGEDDKDTESKLSVWKILLAALNRSKFLLIGVALCAIGMGVVNLKKKEAIKKQLEEDKYDEKRID